MTMGLDLGTDLTPSLRDARRSEAIHSLLLQILDWIASLRSQ
jgi:hypothetical protein